MKLLLDAKRDLGVRRKTVDTSSSLPRQEQARLLTANLRLDSSDLGNGAIVSLSPTRLAVRSLPIG